MTNTPMKSRTVDTITTSEELLRLRIYEGDIPLSDAGAELVRIARHDLKVTHSRLGELAQENRRLRMELAAQQQ